MRVCIVTTAFPRWANDTRGVFVFEAASALQRRGVEVRVIAIHSPGAKHHETINGIEIYRPRYLIDRWEILQKDSAGIPQAWQGGLLSRLVILPFLWVHTLSTAIYARDCDLIHANWTLSAASAALTQWIHRRPFLVTVQGSDIFQAAQKPIIRQITRFALKKASRVMALSQSLAREVSQLVPSEKPVVIMPNGVDTNKFLPPQTHRRDPIILFVGSFIERKGVRYLIEALHQIHTKMPECRLVLVGEGAQQRELESLANSLGLKDEVRFTGPQSQPEVMAWMQKASVFVLPSLEEGQGVVLMEAMACGTPCVGTNVGGIPDVVTQETGFLVPPADSSALAEAIMEVLRSRERWEQLSKESRRRAVEVYNWDTIASRIEAVYQEIGKYG